MDLILFQPKTNIISWCAKQYFPIIWLMGRLMHEKYKKSERKMKKKIDVKAKPCTCFTIGIAFF